MRFLTIISIFFCFIFNDCKKSSTTISACIQEKIDSFKTSAICKHGATVQEYSFQGKLVYVFDERNCCCDMAASVFDANCTYLGMLGGFLGFTKINGVVFASNATLKRTLWSN